MLGVLVGIAQDVGKNRSRLYAGKANFHSDMSAVQLVVDRLCEVDDELFAAVFAKRRQRST